MSTAELSKFKQYYANPEFREKHLTDMKCKLPCSGCGFVTSRANMTKHKRSRNHLKRMKGIEESQVLALQNKIDRLKQRMKKMIDE